MPWVVEMDDETNLPVKDENGEYIATKTAGMSGTQADVIRAVQSRNVFMVHVVDAIDTLNISHNPDGKSIRVPEGYIWSSLDCVAVDLLCARYCFKTVPMVEALKLKEENGWTTEFVHHVPVARSDGTNIVTEEGLDSPLFRYNLYRYTEERGVGQQKYYVVGWDSLTETPLASLGGHLGRIENLQFHELMTRTMYYNPTCMLWDMQKTLLSYTEAHDVLTGSSLVKEFLDSFDENKDGIIDYDENGRKGFWTPGFRIVTYSQYLRLIGKYGEFRGGFNLAANFLLKPTRQNWNPQGHDFAREYVLVWIATLAFDMSRSETVSADPFVPGMTWGKGRWPSWQLATYMQFVGTLYGPDLLKSFSLQAPYGAAFQHADKPLNGGSNTGYMLFAGTIDGPDLSKSFSLHSLYGAAFQYADKALNGGGYTGSTEVVSAPDSISKYIEAVSQGAAPLDFTLYVPVGYGSLDTFKTPNVEETEDPEKIFTAHFNRGQEVW
jgi:hypothetical protein